MNNELKFTKFICLVVIVIYTTLSFVLFYHQHYFKSLTYVGVVILAIYATWKIHLTQGKIKFGCTRVVYLVGNYAFKFPVLVSWNFFLQGLIGNMQESYYSKYMNLDSRLCPVIFSIWGGFLNVMPRCESLTMEDFEKAFSLITFEEWSMADIIETDKYHITLNGLPVENKRDSFGRLNGHLVAVDYGSWDRINYIEKEEQDFYTKLHQQEWDITQS